MKRRRLQHVLLALCVSTSGLAAEGPVAGSAQLSLDDLRTFTDVFTQVRSNFVEEVDDITLLNAAIHGMVSELDPYSSFLDAEAFRNLDNTSRGRYGGIGAGVTIRDRRIVVREMTAGGPASRAGVQVGDLITAIDGRPVRGRPLDESIATLRGTPGTEVLLRLKTAGKPPRELRLTREYLPVASVEGELLESGHAYLRISHFHEESHTEFERIMGQLQVGRDTPIKGFVLDLRQNLGGVLQAAVAIADGFLDEGMIVYTKSRYPATRLEFRAKPGQWAPGAPLVVLVDGKTASAAEVLAGALQDHRRAQIVGRKTFGKGSVQSVLALRNGSALSLTTALYFTPAGTSLQNNGIEPDLVVDGGSEDDPLGLALELLGAGARK